MVKPPTKTLVNKKNLLNYTSNTLLEYNPSKKSRQEINRENYQKHKDERKKQRRERYAQQKEQTELSTKQTHSKYYQATNIKILMSLKEYINLNKATKKPWLDFNQTLKDIKEEITDIVPIMKLWESAENLINDYWETAKSEIKKGKNWNALDYDEQQKLIRYWGYEKSRIENNFIDTAEQLEKQSQAYLKELEFTVNERGNNKVISLHASKQGGRFLFRKYFTYFLWEGIWIWAWICWFRSSNIWELRLFPIVIFSVPFHSKLSFPSIISTSPNRWRRSPLLETKIANELSLFHCSLLGTNKRISELSLPTSLRTSFVPNNFINFSLAHNNDKQKLSSVW